MSIHSNSIVKKLAKIPLMPIDEVIFGIVFGAVLGFGFRHLMKFCEHKDLIDRQSYVAQYVSLAMFTIGVTTMLGSDDLLAAFSCGTAFAWDGFFNRQTEQSVFSSVIDLLFNIAAFVFIGAWMPFNSFENAELTLSVWRLIVIAILVLLLRRLPVMLALYRWIPDVKTFREAVFSGHFGPIGVGAVFISTLAAEALPKPENPQEDQVQMLAATIQPIVSFMVLTSITIHGLSIPFFSLGRRVHSVSRTWSRHQSMDPSAGPEWATHTRRVSRPEDIIINRDRGHSNRESALERGELGLSTPNEKMSRRGSSMIQDEKSGHYPSSAESDPHMNGASDRTAVSASGEEARPDTPPDGEELTAEWKEGSDLVVEQRAGPGEEVDVQVLPGAAEDDEGGSSVLGGTRAPAPEAEETANRIKNQLKEKVEIGKEDLEDDLHNIKNEIRGGMKELEEKIRGTPSGTESPAESSKDAVSRRPSQNENEDDDEGWASEGSDVDSTTGSHQQRHERADSRHRSKSPKLKIGSKSAHQHAHPSRRRNSFRKGMVGRNRPSTAPAITTTVVDLGEDEERGRRITPTLHGGFGGSLHHRRVDSLRTPIVSRSASPARSVRSIRFADDERTDTAASSPLSPKQVAFDLPSRVDS